MKWGSRVSHYQMFTVQKHFLLFKFCSKISTHHKNSKERPEDKENTICLQTAFCKLCASHLSHRAMAECLLKQALGTQPKQTFTRVKRDNVLTLLNKQEMDFQDISLSYSQEADQTHGVKHKRTVFQFSMQSSICVNHLDPEQHKLQEKAGKTWSKMEMNIREAAC